MYPAVDNRFKPPEDEESKAAAKAAKEMREVEKRAMLKKSMKEDECLINAYYAEKARKE